MDNRDNLEQYIKKQVEAIEFHDEDKMWENFSSNYPVSKDRRPYIIIWGLAISLLILITYFAFSSNIFGIVQNKSNSNELTETSTNVEVLKETANLSINETNDEAIINQLNTEQEELTIASKEAVSNKVVSNVSNKIEENTDQSLGLDLISSLNASTKSSKKQNTSNKNINETISSSSKNMIGNNTFQEKNDEINTVNKNLNKEILDQEDISITPIASKKIKELKVPDKFLLFPIPFDEMPSQNRTERLEYNQIKIEYRAATSQYRTEYHALGLAYQFKLNKKRALTIGGGLQYSHGYSVSLDSLRRVISLSITDYIKQKDLSYLNDAYFTTSYDWSWKNFQLSLGGKVKYGLQNRFLIVETNRIVHNQFFNFSNGTTTETHEMNDWSTLNRWRIETFGELSYQPFNGKLEIGLTVSRQLNPLIKQQIAARGISNTPIQLGVHAKLPINIIK